METEERKFEPEQSTHMYVDFAKLRDKPEKEPVISQSQGYHLKNSLVVGTMRTAYYSPTTK